MLFQVIFLIFSGITFSFAAAVTDCGSVNIQDITPEGNIDVRMTSQNSDTPQPRLCSPNSVKIPAEYIVTPCIGAHKLHLRRVTWNEARNICIHEGGHLAAIDSESEEKILLQMLEEAKLDDALLGVHDQFKEGDWVTVEDVPLGQMGWSKWSNRINPNPDNLKNIQHCGRLLKTGGMDDIECNSPRPFICKRPPEYN